ncbi:hypothetical protein E5E96_16935 [Aeromonas sp. 1805]|uniref:hypothetical protein n=1 Tax=Aeromonas sp. 1805 TaxID=2560028 RepID=UPI00148B13C6|nr:hypothetical protein [Aeromonas sp. 1805]QJT18812.1 hypothetical protein E5E96_16935 [Aeromonas sp. 1805]
MSFNTSGMGGDFILSGMIKPLPIELFSYDPRSEELVSSKEWKDKGFTLIDGSDSDSALDQAKIPPFFLNLYRHASDDKELKDNDLTVKKLENAVDSIESYDRVKGMVVKHSWHQLQQL